MEGVTRVRILHWSSRHLVACEGLALQPPMGSAPGALPLPFQGDGLHLPVRPPPL